MKVFHHFVVVGALATVVASATLINGAGAAPMDAARKSYARPAQASSSCWSWRDAEKGFIRRINYERRARGIAQLYWDRHLGRVSREHTNEMIHQGRLHHTSVRALTWRVTNWNTLGENVGVGGGVSSLHRAFMNSPSHRANVLYRRFRHVGVGTRYDSDGTLWVTVTFETVRNPGTRLSMPRC